MTECAVSFKSEGIEKLNFSSNTLITVKIGDMKSLIIFYLKYIEIPSFAVLNIK